MSERIVADLIARLGLTEKEREAFLSPDYEAHTHDPFLMRDMQKAAERIRDAIVKGEKVAVYADFDADGIPAAVILWDFFKKVGVEPRVYIPHRHHEGYGFHPEAVDALAEEGVQLIVTVDVGINGSTAAQRAHERGVDVIITDHHELPEQLPDAYAIVHPRVGAYPFPHLCGAAVAYKLVQATLALLREGEVIADVPEGWEKWLLDMVGIATVADMVPLVGENRVLATYGLTVLRKTPRKGIRALCKRHRINQSSLTEEDIGFIIAPRINAASRMDEPEAAFALLTSEDEDDAKKRVAFLEKLNNQRKGAVAAIVKVARTKVGARDEVGPVTVAGDPQWNPALLGLAANSVLDGRAGVVCLWGRDGRGVLKGSCRSDGSVHVVDMFKASGIVLDESGGHACAGGFSVSHERVHTLAEHFTEAVRGGKSSPTEGKPEPIRITAAECTVALIEKLRVLAPFGVGNEKPQFMLSTVQIEEVRVFGKEGNHTELYVRTEGKRLRAYQFFKTPDDFTHVPAVGDVVTLYGTLERDQFKGAHAFALRTVDICAAGEGDTITA